MRTRRFHIQGWALTACGRIQEYLPRRGVREDRVREGQVEKPALNPHGGAKAAVEAASNTAPSANGAPSSAAGSSRLAHRSKRKERAEAPIR